MAVSRKLDTVGFAPAGKQLINRPAPFFCFILCFFLAWPGSAAAQAQAPDTSDQLSTIKQLFEEKRWEQIVLLAQSSGASSPELNYYYGVALAQTGKFDRAFEVLRAGHDRGPSDKRFLTELAGVEFKRKRYSEAAKWMQRALALDPADAYANDFLGSVHFLDGNLPAALKYWNQAGKPRIASIRMDLEPAVDPVLLDSAFAFSAASTLRLPDLLTTRARLDGLGIFSRYALDLTARDEGDFDVTLRASQYPTWGRNKLQSLLGLFRGVYLQTVYPEFFNLRGSGTNVVSLIRWDKEKRRVVASLSGPLRRDAARRYSIGIDLRNENWDIRNASRGPAPLLGALNLRKQAVQAEYTSLNSGRWNWSTGVEFSRRDYRRVITGTALDPELLAEGNQLKHLAEVNYELLQLPEKRLVVAARGNSELARLWSQPSRAFAKFQGSLGAHWLPQARGDDYEMQTRLRAGTTAGSLPFDELFMLGLERDNDLWLRGHIGSRDGRKGSSPLGSGYVLANWEIDKIVYAHPLASLRLSPFLDVGKITDSPLQPSSSQWHWDTGLQTKLRALGVGVTFTYGKDLRSGANVFYVALGK